MAIYQRCVRRGSRYWPTSNELEEVNRGLLVNAGGRRIVTFVNNIA